jgi:hypothetical protein
MWRGGTQEGGAWGGLEERGRGEWVNWGEGDGGKGGGQGGGGGHAGVFPTKDWLKGVPLLPAEREALRSLKASYTGRVRPRTLKATYTRVCRYCLLRGRR